MEYPSASSVHRGPQARSLRWRSRAVGATLFLFGASAAATETTPIRVDYSAPDDCPGRDALVRHILGRTNRARIAGSSEEGRELQVRVARSGSRFHGRLVVPSLNQERQVDDAKCEEVVEALGFFIALIIDPSAGSSSPPVGAGPTATEEPPPSADAAIAQEPPSTQAPSSSVPSPASSSPSPSSSSEPPPSSTESSFESSAPMPGERSARSIEEPSWRFGGGVGAAAVSGVAHGTVIGSRVLIELAKTPTRPPHEDTLFAPSFAIAGTSTSTSTIDSSRGSLALRWQSLGASFCPIGLSLPAHLSLRPCTALEVGRVRADGIAMPNARRNDAPWVALGLVAQMEMTVWSKLALRAERGAASPFTRSRFNYSSGEVVHATPILGARAAVTLVLRP